MLHVYEPVATIRSTEKPRHYSKFHRSPIVPVSMAAMVGIVADRYLSLRFVDWLIVSAGLISIAILLQLAGWLYAGLDRSNRGNSFRRDLSQERVDSGMSMSCGGSKLRQLTRINVLLLCDVASVICLLGACVGCGATWHHWRLSCLPEDDLSAWAESRGAAVRIAAKIIQSPLILKVPDAEQFPWRPAERTVVVVQCRALLNEVAHPQSVSGIARLSVDGRCDHIVLGDEIEVIGELSRPSESSNPGDFDAAYRLRTQGISCLLSAEFPESVRVIGRDRTWFDGLKYLRSAARLRAERLVEANLDRRTAPVAASLLLGSRVDLDRDLRRAFAESGTLHVLAISGMNVGLLWSWLWIIGRSLRFRPTMLLGLVLVFLPAYAVLTDANPPVVRATIVAMALAFGQLARRRASVWNSLALALLFVLSCNPSDVFSSGAQLSFLAVAAILISMRFVRDLTWNQPEDEGLRNRPSLLRVILVWLIHKFVESFVVGAAIWLVTSPLIAAEFHLVSPIGFVLNVLLSPLIVVMFWIGYTFLLLGMLSSVGFGWLGIPFGVTLGWFLDVVEFSSRLQLGHVYVPAPPNWWLLGFYALVVIGSIIDRFRMRLFFSPRIALSWVVFGLSISLWPSASGRLSCTFLSVGHGLSVLIECPNGRTLLYDAGGMMGGGRVSQIVEKAVWESGHTCLDAVMISHADADHCNAVAELMNALPTKTMLVHRSFLDWTQSAVALTLKKAEASGVTVRLVSAGQSIQLDTDVTLRVIHPTADFRSFHDNANSLVVCVEFAGRRLLLTGDLEREGLWRLMRQPPLKADVLLAPHHGSLKANTNDLARWADPDWIVVSNSSSNIEKRLSERYGASVQILSTIRHGAIQCVISRDGEIEMRPFRQSRL